MSSPPQHSPCVVGVFGFFSFVLVGPSILHIWMYGFKMGQKYFCFSIWPNSPFSAVTVAYKKEKALGVILLLMDLYIYFH